MKLFINETHFIHVLQRDEEFICQIMKIVGSTGIAPATFFDHPENTALTIVNDSYYSIKNINFITLGGVFDYHKLCMQEWIRYKQIENMKEAGY